MSGVAVDWKGIGAVTLLDAGVTHDAHGRVYVPYRYPDGRTAKTKVFHPNGRSWWSPVGVDQIPLGLEQVAQGQEREQRVQVICEGESDTLAVRDALAVDHDGLPVDVIGLPGAGTWRSEWANHIIGYARAYVVGDGDELGRRMMDTVIRSVGWVRPVRLADGDDARGVVQRSGERALDVYLDKADKTAVVAAAFRLATTLTSFRELMGGVE